MTPREPPRTRWNSTVRAPSKEEIAAHYAKQKAKALANAKAKAKAKRSAPLVMIRRPKKVTPKKPRKAIPKINVERKAKRRATNQEYYASAEWRGKRKAVFERDGYRCVEITKQAPPYYYETLLAVNARCPNRGEIVNGKQTARGLVAEESGYLHRGIPDAIDRIKTRCKDCDRRLTPLERPNHAQGFNGGLGGKR